jgi:alcohol dehydrogenase class IV
MTICLNMMDTQMNANTDINYDFIAPRQIVFGWGRRRCVGTLAKTLGNRAFVVCGSHTLHNQGVIAEIFGLLRGAAVEPVDLATIEHEPEVLDVDRAANTLREQKAGPGDFLLAVGGGSAIDLAKAVAAMAVNRESFTVRDYLENVGRDLKFVVQPLPVLAMPTTAGTGAEATCNAVISSRDPPFKKSLRDQRIMPRIALVDPELCISVPPQVTAASGMDAITQLIESFISRKAQPIPRALTLEALPKAWNAIAEAVENGASRPARTAMSHAALLSGMALANSGLGMAHGVAAALGIHCQVPHGLACAVMLPLAMRVNSQVCQADMARLARLVLPRGMARSPKKLVDQWIDVIEKLCDRVRVPLRLSALGVTAEQIPAIVKSSRGSSMSGNPRDLTDQELTELLIQIY